MVVSSIPSARNNNLVSESDYYAAITALQQKIKEKGPSTVINNHDSSLIIQQQLYNDCSNSLCEQIQKIVQPISDEAFHTYLSQYNDNYSACIPPNKYTTRSNDASSSSCDNPAIVPVDDVTFTEDELRDHVAMKRVQELRQQVRDKVQRLLQLRQSTIQRAISITERQVAVLSLRSSSSSNRNHSQNDMESDDHEKVTSEKLLEQHQNALLQMKESFMNLYESIHSNNSSTSSSSNLVLPTQLKNEYQNTIHVIEQGLMPPSLVSTGHRASQIEQAIHRRDYYHVNEPDVVMKECNHDDDDTVEEQKHDPEQTLFNLLCR
jgi:hypothetical protein